MDKPKTALITKPIWRGSRVHLPWPALFHGRQHRKCAVRFLLIPVGYGSHIVLSLKQASMIHPNLLDSHLQVLLKQDRIHDVPTVKASLGHLVVDIYQGALPATLPFLKEKLSLSYTMTGFILMMANFTSSVLQPLFG